MPQARLRANRSPDGYRVLIDRIWPRGVTREEAQLSEWARELAPSTELRRWFGHDPARFGEFRRRYTAELAAQEGKLRELRRLAGTLTLVYAAREADLVAALRLPDCPRFGRARLNVQSLLEPVWFVRPDSRIARERAYLQAFCIGRLDHRIGPRGDSRV